MSRSDYSDDLDQDLSNLWRANVERTIKGRRGQAFLKEMASALDEMPNKELISGELEHKGNVCAIGSVGAKRTIDMSNIDPEDYTSIAKTFDISEALAREIMYINDEEDRYWVVAETPEKRWQRVRNWVEKQIVK